MTGGSGGCQKRCEPSHTSARVRQASSSKIYLRARASWIATVDGESTRIGPGTRWDGVFGGRAS